MPRAGYEMSPAAGSSPQPAAMAGRRRRANRRRAHQPIKSLTTRSLFTRRSRRFSHTHTTSSSHTGPSHRPPRPRARDPAPKTPRAHGHRRRRLCVSPIVPACLWLRATNGAEGPEPGWRRGAAFAPAGAAATATAALRWRVLSCSSRSWRRAAARARARSTCRASRRRTLRRCAANTPMLHVAPPGIVRPGHAARANKP